MEAALFPVLQQIQKDSPEKVWNSIFFTTHKTIQSETKSTNKAPEKEKAVPIPQKDLKTCKFLTPFM